MMHDIQAGPLAVPSRRFISGHFCRGISFKSRPKSFRSEVGSWIIVTLAAFVVGSLDRTRSPRASPAIIGKRGQKQLKSDAYADCFKTNCSNLSMHCCDPKCREVRFSHECDALVFSVTPVSSRPVQHLICSMMLFRSAKEQLANLIITYRPTTLPLPPPRFPRLHQPTLTGLMSNSDQCYLSLRIFWVCRERK